METTVSLLGLPNEGTEKNMEATTLLGNFGDCQKGAAIGIHCSITYEPPASNLEPDSTR